jgi:hypothetical protein
VQTLRVGSNDVVDFKSFLSIAQKDRRCNKISAANIFPIATPTTSSLEKAPIE